MVEMESNFYAQYSNMIGPLAQIIRASNLFKKFQDILVSFDVSQTSVYYDLIG